MSSPEVMFGSSAGPSDKPDLSDVVKNVRVFHCRVSSDPEEVTFTEASSNTV